MSEPTPPAVAALRRIGVFGGAFDPPHLTHVALARAALAQLQLDQLRVLPTGQAWHKPRALTDATHRLAMAALAFEPLAGVVVDARETLRQGPTYTVDTLRELAREFPGAELVLIMGADQLAALSGWHEHDEVMRLATIAVAERATAAGQTPAPPLAAPPGARLVRLSLPASDASATRIRERVAQGAEITPLVPAPVAGYIERHHLYIPA